MNCTRNLEEQVESAKFPCWNWAQCRSVLLQGFVVPAELDLRWIHSSISWGGFYFVPLGFWFQQPQRDVIHLHCTAADPQHPCWRSRNSQRQRRTPGVWTSAAALRTSAFSAFAPSSNKIWMSGPSSISSYRLQVSNIFPKNSARVAELLKSMALVPRFAKILMLIQYVKLVSKVLINTVREQFIYSGELWNHIFLYLIPSCSPYDHFCLD